MSLLKPIKQKRISDQVFEQIRELIWRGELKPGEKVLPEREMAEAMQVSRSTIRSAIRRLTAMGLLEQRQGAGTFVSTTDPVPVYLRAQGLAPLSLKDLLEVRLGIECYAAALAAKRADESDLNAMEKSLAAMENEFSKDLPAAHSDVSFHMAIAFAAKNPVHIFIMNSMNKYLFLGQQELLEKIYKLSGNKAQVLNQHRDIIQSIRARSPEGASAAMERHIRWLQDFISGQIPAP